MRVPGLHLENRQISLDGEQVAGNDSRARDSRGLQLRHAEKERLGRVLLRAENRNLAGGAPRVASLEEPRAGARAAERISEDQNAERARGIRAAAGSHHVGPAREPHRPQRRSLGLSQQPRGDVPARSADGDSRPEHGHDDRAVVDVLHDAERAAGAARGGHAHRRHGRPDAESACPGERRQGAARHLVRQAPRAPHGTLQDQRQTPRHVPAELGGDHRPGVRRGRAGAARHRCRQSAGGRRQAAARREEAPRRSRVAEGRPNFADGAERSRFDGRHVVLRRGAQEAARETAGADDRRWDALCHVHGHGVHVPAAARQQRGRHLRSAHWSAIHERPARPTRSSGTSCISLFSTAWS